MNGKPIDLSKKLSRFQIQPITDDEEQFSIKPLSKDDEGGIVEVALIALKDNSEVNRLELKFGVKLMLLTDLKPVKPEFPEETTGELVCELNKKPEKLVVFKNAKKPVEAIYFNSEPKPEGEKIDQEKFTLELIKNKDSTFKVKLGVKILSPCDADTYWIQFNDNELTTNEANLKVQATELKFTDNIKTPNNNPLEGVEHIEIQFSLNKNVPSKELINDVQVLLRRPLKKDDVLNSNDYELVLYEETEKPKDSKSYFFALKMKNQASLIDTGSYSLKIKSSGQKSPNSLDINVMNKNLFCMELPESIEIFEQEPLRLQVKCNQPIQNYHWLKDAEKVQSGEPPKSDRMSFAFTIPEAKLSDAGTYEFLCADFKKKENSDSIKSSSKCIVTIKKRPEKQVKSLNDLGTIKIKEGETLTLPVKFDKPMEIGDIKLFQNGKEFVPTEHGNDVEVKLSPLSNTFTMQINNAMPGRDEGRYKLTSPNTESECTVIVEEKPIKFVTELENFKIKVLPAVFYETNFSAEDQEALQTAYPQTAQFDCQLSKPCNDVTWLFNDKPIDESRFQTHTTEDGKKHFLTVKNCLLSDNNVNITIKLNKSQKKSTAQLKIEQVPMDTLIKIRKPLDDVRAKETETVSFSCDIQLNPLLSQLKFPLAVKWFANEQVIKSSPDKFQISEETDKNMKKLILTVNNCQLPDQVEYACKIFMLVPNKDPVLLAETVAKLFVKEIEPKLLKDLPSTLTIFENEPIELECELSKPNLNVEWSKDGVLLKDKKYEITSYTKSDTSYAYRIKLPKSELRDAGRYKLVFKSISTECRVIIKKPKLEISTPLEQVIYVKETHDATFKSEFSQTIANDSTRCEWFKNGKRLYFSNKSMKYQMNLLEKRCNLVVKNCMTDDQADFELRVYTDDQENPLVQRTKLIVVPLNITILEPLEDISVNESETAKLNLKASKPCECTWYKLKVSDFKKVIADLDKNPSLLNDSTVFSRVEANERVVFTSKPDNSYGLTINDSQTNETGHYLANLTLGDANKGN